MRIRASGGPPSRRASRAALRYTEGLRRLLRRPLSIRDPLHTTGAGALGYYLEYTGLPDLPPRLLLAKAYWKGSPELAYRAAWLPADSDEGFVPRDRLRVGFLAAFFFRHSVGLLTEGVIRTLDRRRFHVSVLRIDGEPTDELVLRYSE